MGRTFVWAVLGSVYGLGLTLACSDGAVVRYERPNANAAGAGTSSPGLGAAGQGGSTGAGLTGQGVGEACSDVDTCRDGLVCGGKGMCEPGADKAAGESCTLSAECADGQCVGQECVAAGKSGESESCATDADCSAGLRCSLVGLGLSCQPEGAADLGSKCSLSSDCLGGLACLKATCSVPPVGVSPLGQPWAGVTCDPPVKTDVKAYFEVPLADGADEGDFFRLPFPTDVRRSQNKLDLSDFPTPGTGFTGTDPVKLYVDAISENDSGWGAYPTVIFRFSGPFDFATFTEDALEFIDVTDPAKGRSIGWRRFFTDGRTNYICDNFVAVQPPLGSALEPDHTYAVFIQSEAGGKTLSGRADHKPVTASDNMAAVLKATAPADAKLKAAHTAFAPLRDYLAAKKIPASNVLTASVFTVGPVQAQMTALAKAVSDGAAPTATNWLKCGGNVMSKCPQAEGERACGDGGDGYDEYQAMLTLPVFQQGDAPYLTPDDGGAIDAAKPHDEDVCLSLTVPKGTPPAAGWPTVVFAHGTGGSYRDHVRDEVAGVLARATPKFAVLGIDQVEHGPRRHASTASPNDLFFNFSNPAAARGNPLQGAADQLSVARFAKTLSIDAATSTGSAIKLDGTKLFFFGHSQGSTEGSLMLPFGDDFKAAVLSGNGASLKDALRTKTKPVDIAAALPLVLQDPVMTDKDLGPGVTQFHPVLSLLQQWIDPAEPLSFAAALGKPLTGHRAKHVFQTFGIEDSYSPPVTLATFAVAAGLTQVTPDSSAKPVWNDGNVLPIPVAVGYQATGNGVTLGMREYGAPKGSDGHFVAFDNQTANADVVLFLTGAAGTKPPVIGK